MTHPTPTFDAIVAAALERLAAENAQSARTARAAGEKDDARFFQRAANAYVRALQEWQQGTRLERTPGGNWLLPSRSGGAAHLLTLDGDWMCSCAAGDDIERFDDGGETAVEEPEPPTPAPQDRDGRAYCTPDDPCWVHAPCDMHRDEAEAYFRQEAARLGRRIAQARAEVLRRAA